MKTTLRKTVATIAAVVTAAMGMISMSAFAYESKGDWSVYSVKGAPNGGPYPSSSVSMYTYGGGYQSYCESITGSNDRLVTVSESGMSSYTITSTGYSGKHTSTTSTATINRYSDVIII